MIELLAIGVIASAMAVALLVGLLLLLKFVLTLFFWPIRLALKLIFLPLVLVGVALKMVVGLALLPVLGLVIAFGTVLTVIAVAVPLVPFFVVGLLIWLLVKHARPARVPDANLIR